MKDKAIWIGKPDAIGPNFGAAWSGSPEEKEEANRVAAYIEAGRKRLWGESA
jgi:hypothetical protein